MSTYRFSTSVFGGAVLLVTFASSVACNPSGVVCRAGTSLCGDGCADYASDSRNCGACGIACGDAQVCSGGRCECQAGTEPCDGRCSATAYDPAHCGGCGRACASAEVCEAGACKSRCELGTALQCGGSCVDVRTDASHCGRCSHVCGEGQSCRSGVCGWDIVAACFSTGQVVGIQTGTELRGPLMSLGTNPAALALSGAVLLVADGTEHRLYQANFPGLEKLDVFSPIGAVPNQVLVDGEFIYVVNAESGSLQVLQKTGTGARNGELLLSTVAELWLGQNTYPQGAAKLGDSLWLPLYGGDGAIAAAAGQKVVRVSIENPAQPRVTQTIELQPLDLRAFAGGTPLARPWAIVTHRGAVYAVLNNLNPGDRQPGGPGLLARIDPQTGAATTVALGGEKCLNPQWAVSDGSSLIVSCGGRAVYGPTWELQSNEGAGLVVLDDHDAVVAFWTAECPAGGAGPNGGTTCQPILPGRLALTAGRVYLGDQNKGRLFVLEVTDAGFVERRGYSSAGGGPIAACPENASGYANVSDVLAVP
jgi:hypothetical protein